MLVLQEKIQFSEYSSLYELIVPKDNLLRKINDLIDFSFIHDELINKYCLTLTEEDKKNNQQISSSRVTVENVIRSIKTFRILAEKYRNRRKRFTLRLNLIAGIYHYQL